MAEKVNDFRQMSVLAKPAHEKFAQLVAQGKSGTEAYLSVFGASRGAGQSAYRLLKKAEIVSRVSAIKAEIGSHLLKTGLTIKQERLNALQLRWNRLNAVIEERAQKYGRLNWHGIPLVADKPDEVEGMTAPGATTGLVVLDYRGKNAEQAIWKVDTGLLAEMRQIERRAAEEMGELVGEDDRKDGGNLQINVVFVSGQDSGPVLDTSAVEA